MAVKLAVSVGGDTSNVIERGEGQFSDITVTSIVHQQENTVIREFPSQRTNNVQRVSMSHHEELKS